MLLGLNEAEESDGIDELYKCPITRKLMEDPVISHVSEITYERSAIVNVINSTGKDPFNNCHTTVADLTPDRTLLRLIQDYKNLSKE